MIRIICVGKIKEKYLTDLINDYEQRINKYHKLIITEIMDSNPIEEAKKVIPLMEQKGYYIALTLSGEKMDSLKFANFINDGLMNYANLNFIIGSSTGLDSSIINKCNKQISFSDLTFPHGLFRGILLEQIYRSFKINNNETYHK